MKEATYFCLEAKEGVTSGDILTDPEAFVRALKSTFGTGSKLVERTLLREINALYSLPEDRSYSLEEALENARNRIGDYRNHRDSSQFFDSADRIGKALDSESRDARSSSSAFAQDGRRTAKSKYAHISVALVRLEERRNGTRTSDVDKKPLLVSQYTRGRVLRGVD